MEATHFKKGLPLIRCKSYSFSIVWQSKNQNNVFLCSCFVWYSNSDVALLRPCPLSSLLCLVLPPWWVQIYMIYRVYLNEDFIMFSNNLIARKVVSFVCWKGRNLKTRKRGKASLYHNGSSRRKTNRQRCSFVPRPDNLLPHQLPLLLCLLCGHCKAAGQSAAPFPGRPSTWQLFNPPSTLPDRRVSFSLLHHHINTPNQRARFFFLLPTFYNFVMILMRITQQRWHRHMIRRRKGVSSMEIECNTHHSIFDVTPPSLPGLHSSMNLALEPCHSSTATFRNMTPQSLDLRAPVTFQIQTTNTKQQNVRLGQSVLRPRFW